MSEFPTKSAQRSAPAYIERGYKFYKSSSPEKKAKAVGRKTVVPLNPAPRRARAQSENSRTHWKAAGASIEFFSRHAVATRQYYEAGILVPTSLSILALLILVSFAYVIVRQPEAEAAAGQKALRANIESWRLGQLIARAPAPEMPATNYESHRSSDIAREPLLISTTALAAPVTDPDTATVRRRPLRHGNRPLISYRLQVDVSHAGEAPLKFSASGLDGQYPGSRVTLAGIPDGLTPSVGLWVGPGFWTLTPQQLTELSLIIGVDAPRSFDLHIALHAAEGELLNETAATIELRHPDQPTPSPTVAAAPMPLPEGGDHRADVPPAKPLRRTAQPEKTRPPESTPRPAVVTRQAPRPAPAPAPVPERPRAAQPGAMAVGVAPQRSVQPSTGSWWLKPAPFDISGSMSTR